MTISADELIEQLGDVPDFLIRARDAFYHHGSQPNAWTGAPGSPFQEDVASGLAGPGGSWGDKPFKWIAETCGTYLAATVEHLRCLGLMLKDGGFLMSPEVIVRATYETTMRVAWILDHSATPKQRVARLHLEAAFGLRRALEGYSRVWPDIATDLKQVRRQIFEVDMPQLFTPDETEFGDQTPVREWRLANEPYLSPEEVWKIIAERSEINEREATGMYAVLSAYVHPNPIELQRRMIVTEDGKGRGFSVTAPYLRALVGSAVSGYYTAYRLQTGYLGWDPTVFEQWEADATAVLPEYFSDDDQ